MIKSKKIKQALIRSPLNRKGCKIVFREVLKRDPHNKKEVKEFEQILKSISMAFKVKKSCKKMTFKSSSGKFFKQLLVYTLRSNKKAREKNKVLLI